MKRTTVFLPDDLHERLRREAFERRLSMAEIIRNHLERPLAPVATDPLSGVIGIVEDGTLTQRIDEELYSS